MEVVDKLVIDLEPYKNNAKQHPKEQVELIKKSIKEFGFCNPILIDKNNKIIAGHGRVLASKELDLETVPCILIENLTPTQIKAYRILDNKSAESEWDFDMLKLEFDDLESEDYDLDLTGFLEDDRDFMCDGIETEEDDFDTDKAFKEPKYKVKLGEVWQLGNHRLVCGYATIKEDVDKLMDGNKADMCFTDPPYNVNYSSKNELLNLYDKGNRIQDEIIIDNFIDPKKYMEFNKRWMDILITTLSDYNSIYVCGNYETLIGFYDFDFKISNILVWVKNSLVLGRMDYKCKHENILYGWYNHHKWYGKNNTTTVLEFDRPSSSKLHPTMKPIELIAHAIDNSSKKGMNVLDVFGGSGSTLIACEQTKRKCYMMELDTNYCSVIIERWEQYTNKKGVKL